ncbi:Protein of uncharacterised function (DUF3644) [Serratia marcescens]|uniref:DUF3644 domain-containing protein n=1 Tax=Serratia marcescens TaxID=615 RepID=UPI0007455F56|nr:DUF3644 domain-containing protein [Serratia marcescens]CVG72111.1 Protein of uncharacterised function (DUF3644) [Serratia marcescens]
MTAPIDKKLENVDKAFDFFRECRKENKFFDLPDVTKKTNWGLSTVKTYSTKRWGSFIKKTEKGYMVTEKFDRFDKKSFRKHHSQKETSNKYFYNLLVEKSITACIAAIEVYNKPDFIFREESFSILMINAWELILKAKILELNNDTKDSIYMKSKGEIQLSPSGSPKTIAITRAVGLLEGQGVINKLVADNIKLLIEIRDGSVHFVHDDMTLSTKIQSIGTASLKNFMTLAMSWFDYDFRKYNFYLMPVSFYHLSDMESFSVDNKFRENLLNYLGKIEKEHDIDDDPNFSISLRLETKFVKTSSEEAMQIRITDDPDAPEIQIVEEDALKNHPHTYNEICTIIRKRYRDFKQNSKFNELMRDMKKQGDKFCRERKLDPKNPKSIHKIFYSSRVIDELDKHYHRK